MAPLPVVLVTSTAVDLASVSRAIAAAGFRVLVGATVEEALAAAGELRRECLEVNGLLVDAGAHTATLDGRDLQLTDAEFDLLQLLTLNAGRLVTREELSRHLRGLPYDGLDRTVDLRVARLRQKLGDDARRPRFIRSIRGEGYLLQLKSA
jgi:two-component system, OmpR family, response regulator RstA